MSSVHRAVFLIADESQFEDYLDFRQEVEAYSQGVVSIEDNEDISSSEAMKVFLENRDVIVIVCSDSMKECIDEGRTHPLKFDRTNVCLYGGVLKQFLERSEILEKVILVSIDGSDRVPVALNCIPDSRYMKASTVSKVLVKKITSAIKGIL